MVLLLECRGERDALSSERDATFNQAREGLTTASSSGVISSPQPAAGADPSSEGTLISFNDDDDDVNLL